MPTTDNEFVPVTWTMGPPSVASWLGEAVWDQILHRYNEAMDDWLARQPQCAPAIGVHRGCEHDEEVT